MIILETKKNKKTLVDYWNGTSHIIVTVVIIRFALMIAIAGSTEAAPLALLKVMYTIAVIASYALVIGCAAWIVLLVSSFAAQVINKIPNDKRIKVKKNE